jgi:F-type H+-transporting ATPase subunit epsilon
MATPFEVFLVTPEREVWSGNATIVIARGSEGEFAVMAGHQPILSQLAIGPLFIQPEDGERLAAAVDGGFIHIVSHGSETRVDVLAEHAELQSEIDLDKARALQADAERRIAADHDAEALADLAKATTRLNLRG